MFRVFSSPPSLLRALRILLPIATALLHSACSHAPQPPLTLLDFSAPPTRPSLPDPVAGARPTLALTLPESPALLDGTGLVYRYDTRPNQPAVYAHARLAAPPAELVHTRLRQNLAAAGWPLARTAGEASLRIDSTLERFEHSLDANASHVHIVLQVSAWRQGRPLAHTRLYAERPAPGHAAGAVAALEAATEDLSRALQDWLIHLPQ